VRSLLVLVVDDDPAHALATAEIAARAGYRTRVASSGAEGIQGLAPGDVDIVVTDLVMRDYSGLDLLAAAQKLGPARPTVVVVTGYGSRDAGEVVLRAGAVAHLMKPLGVEMFRAVLERAGRLARGRALPSPAEGGAGEEPGFAGMVGSAPCMERLFDLVRRVGDTEATVLIEGESGTGKELVARALHRLSKRAGGPFVAVNCAALSPGLLESELYGHERGAFTGAHATRIGRFEAAHTGTLFLDEVGEMPLPLQAKLLRALEEREVVRVGGNDTIPVDVRVLAATNRPLASLATEGVFRQDLFYRLNVVRLQVPPLRERGGDVPLLAEALLGELARLHGTRAPRIDPAVLQRLAAMPWRGNVRELRNCLETMLLTGDGEALRESDLPADADETAPGTRSPRLSMQPLAELERELISNTLLDLGGNRAKAAKILGISTRTLYRRIRDLGLS